MMGQMKRGTVEEATVYLEIIFSGVFALFVFEPEIRGTRSKR
jgi:hypothetical protein